MKTKLFTFLSVVVLLSMVLAACTTPTPAATAVPTKAPEPTKAPTIAPTVAPTVAPTAAPTAVPATAVPPTATPGPDPKCDALKNAVTPAAGALGSKDKPITITFVPSGDTGKITRAGTFIAECLTKMTGLNFKIEIGTTFAASIEAMGAEKAQVGFLNTFSVLLAMQKYQIVPILSTMRKYNTNAVDPDAADAGKMTAYYKGQFIANKASGIKSFADLKGKTFCFVDPNSTSGYIIPNIILKANGIDSAKDFKAVQNAGSHDNVGIAVYKGDCDAGVSYVDVLTDSTANLKAKYPDILDKVAPFAVTDKIPNDGVQVIKSLDVKYKEVIADALVAIAADPGGNIKLKDLYTINGFQKIEAKFYEDFAAVLKKAGVDPATLVK